MKLPGPDNRVEKRRPSDLHVSVFLSKYAHKSYFLYFHVQSISSEPRLEISKKTSHWQ